MTALTVIGIILLVFVGIGAIRATVYIEYRDEVALSVSVLGIRIRILPKKEKKVNIKKFSAKRFRKMLKQKELAEKKKLEKKKKKEEQKKAKKLAKKQAKEEEKKKAKEFPPEHKKKKRSLSENISLVCDILKIFFSRFAKHFRIKVARLNITVATGDAATTAVLYGVAVQGVEYILALLDKATNVKYKKDAEVNVAVDYLSESTSVDISIAFALRVWHLFDILFRVAFSAVKNLVGSKKQ